MYPRTSMGSSKYSRSRSRSTSPVLPGWFSPTSRGRSSGLGSGIRFRVVGMAVICVILGYSLVCLLTADHAVAAHHSVSTSQWRGPIDPEQAQKLASGGQQKQAGYSSGASGFTGGNDAYDGGEMDPKPWKGSSSWSDLNGITSKLSSWNPWLSKTPSTSSAAVAPVNATSSTSGKKLLPPLILGEDEEDMTPEQLAALHATNDTSTGLQFGEELRDGQSAIGARPFVGKCSIVFGNLSPQSVFERALRTHEVHNKMHGYPLHVLRQPLLDDVWTKPAFILSLILRELGKPEGERLQWLLWVDADTIILNPYVPVESFLPPEDFDHVDLLYTNDWNGLNNGVFLIKVSRWSVELLSSILSFRYFKPDVPLTFRDQSAMSIMMSEPHFQKKTLFVPQRWFNGYQGEHNYTLEAHQVRRGDLLVHFAGVGDRDNRMRFWLERAEDHRPDWEIEFKHTTYPTEIKDFWHDERAKRDEAKKKIEDQRKEVEDYINELNRKMAEHGDRLLESDKSKIDEVVEKTKKVLEEIETKEDVVAINNALTALKNASSALDAQADNANKAVVKEAHETIFRAEQLLLTMTDTTGIETEISHIRENIEPLKEEIFKPDFQRGAVLAQIHSVRLAEEALKAKQKSLHELALEAERQKQEALALEEMTKAEKAKEQAKQSEADANRKIEEQFAHLGEPGYESPEMDEEALDIGMALKDVAAAGEANKALEPEPSLPIIFVTATEKGPDVTVFVPPVAQETGAVAENGVIIA